MGPSFIDWQTSMRKSVSALLLVILGTFGGLVYLFSTLIALLFETGLHFAIPPEGLPSRMEWGEDRRPIPKILHQTWKNETVPERWYDAQQSCLELHPDYEYIVLLYATRESDS